MSCRTDQAIPSLINWNSFHKYRLRQRGHSAGSVIGGRKKFLLCRLHTATHRYSRAFKKEKERSGTYKRERLMISGNSKCSEQNFSRGIQQIGLLFALLDLRFWQR
jgi:hypothetical protein